MALLVPSAVYDTQFYDALNLSVYDVTFDSLDGLAIVNNTGTLNNADATTDVVRTRTRWAWGWLSGDRIGKGSATSSVFTGTNEGSNPSVAQLYFWAPGQTCLDNTGGTPFNSFAIRSKELDRRLVGAKHLILSFASVTDGDTFVLPGCVGGTATVAGDPPLGFALEPVTMTSTNAKVTRSGSTFTFSHDGTMTLAKLHLWVAT